MSASDANSIENCLYCLLILFFLKNYRFWQENDNYLAHSAIFHGQSSFSAASIRRSANSCSPHFLFSVYCSLLKFIKIISNKKQISCFSKSQTTPMRRPNLQGVKSVFRIEKYAEGRIILKAA